MEASHEPRREHCANSRTELWNTAADTSSVEASAEKRYTDGWGQRGTSAQVRYLPPRAAYRTCALPQSVAARGCQHARTAVWPCTLAHASLMPSPPNSSVGPAVVFMYSLVHVPESFFQRYLRQQRQTWRPTSAIAGCDHQATGASARKCGTCTCQARHGTHVLGDTVSSRISTVYVASALPVYVPLVVSVRSNAVIAHDTVPDPPVALALRAV